MPVFGSFGNATGITAPLLNPMAWDGRSWMALLQGKLADACDVSRIRIRRVLVKNRVGMMLEDLSCLSVFI